MGLETAAYVNDLNATYPISGDPKSQGDDHLRLIKAVVKATFPLTSSGVLFSNGASAATSIASAAQIVAAIGATAVTNATNATNANYTSAGPSGSAFSFRNKIINGNFRVNQRSAATKTTTASAYNYDRWYYDGTYLYQGIENLNIEDGTYGISWESNATCQWALVSTATAAAAVASGWSGTAVTNGSTFTVSGSSGKNLWIRFATGGDGLNALNKVQVELGGVTPFESRPYGLELSLCQRYYATASFAALKGTKTVAGDISAVCASFPVQMRTVPSYATIVTTTYGIGTQTPAYTTTSISITAGGSIGDRAGLDSYAIGAEL